METEGINYIQIDEVSKIRIMDVNAPVTEWQDIPSDAPLCKIFDASNNDSDKRISSLNKTIYTTEWGQY